RTVQHRIRSRCAAGSTQWRPGRSPATDRRCGVRVPARKNLRVVAGPGSDPPGFRGVRTWCYAQEVATTEQNGSESGVDGRLGCGSTILVADDDRITRELLTQILTSHGYHVEAYEDGQAAVERVGKGAVDLVLLDILMPRITGLEACRLLKGMTADSFLPVVLVTVKTDTASRVEGLKIGADDYVCKPFDEDELIARVEAMLRIKKLHDQVQEARSRLERLSMHDDLTGLYNYRYLHTRLSEEFKRAERYHDPLACVVLDIDRLSAVNDGGGRPVGDNVLRTVAAIVRRTVRDVDVVARFGGDEYLIILPSTHFAGSVTVAERIWREVREHSFVGDLSRRFTVTVSVGVALFPSRDVRTKDALLRSADTALMHAKRDGGNRVCVFQQQGYLYTPAVGESGDGSDGRGEASVRGSITARGGARSILPSVTGSMKAERMPGPDLASEGPVTRRGRE
ncbi:diguanylate cyclase, partial [Myxococcota bacterium]